MLGRMWVNRWVVAGLVALVEVVVVLMVVYGGGGGGGTGGGY